MAFKHQIRHKGAMEAVMKHVRALDKRMQEIQRERDIETCMCLGCQRKRREREIEDASNE